MSSIGEFRILREIDKGSMGIVYLAETSDGQQIAIKTFSVSDSGNEREWSLLRKLLIKEGRRTLDLDHPNIVRTYDVVDDDEADLTYVVMEYVDGPNLDKYLDANPHIEPGPALNLLRQAASALDYAARRGLVHRDVKPANMMITGGGSELKLTDFGIAKRVADFSSASATGVSLSETHRVGTLRYMAPEQITEPSSVTSKADQYGLANVAYLLLTGRGVFHDKTNETSLGYAIVNTAPPKPSQFNQSLRGKVDKVMRRALAKKPEERFPDCTAFVNALEEALFTQKTGIPVWARAAAAVLVVACGIPAGIWFLANHPSQQMQQPVAPATIVNAPPPAREAPPPALVPRPQPPPVREPAFALSILANKNPLPPGATFGSKDAKFGLLGRGDLEASISATGAVPAGTRVTLEWQVDGLPYSTKDLTGRDFSGRSKVVEYDNTPTAGAYRVRLLVNGKPKQTFAFTINDES